MLNDADKLRIAEEIEWEKAKSYTDHGCNITGNLIIARCSKACEAHPRWGQFGAQCSLDVADVARELVGSEVEAYSERLAVPDLVVCVPLGEWEKFAADVEVAK